MTSQLSTIITCLVILSTANISLQTDTIVGRVTDLDANDVFSFNAQASSWSAYPLQTSGILVSFCSTVYLMGGYNILAYPTVSPRPYFRRTYSVPIPHNMILFSGSFYAIDSWDGPTDPSAPNSVAAGGTIAPYGDHFELNFDSQTVRGSTITNYGSPYPSYCGTTYPDYPPIQVIVKVPHSGASLTFNVISYLDQAYTDESLGFRDLSFTFYQTASPTPPPGTYCGTANIPLSEFSCPCLSTSMVESPVGSGTCYACDSSCRKCNSQLKTGCTACYYGYYLDSTGKCLTCHTSCATCFGGASTQCSTCPPGAFLVNNPSTSYICVTQCPTPLTQTFDTLTAHCSSNCPSSNLLWDGSCDNYL